MLGESVFMINSAHKNFYGSVHWTSLDVTQLTYSLYFPVRYYDSSDIEFDTIKKIY